MMLTTYWIYTPLPVQTWKMSNIYRCQVFQSTILPKTCELRHFCCCWPNSLSCKIQLNSTYFWSNIALFPLWYPMLPKITLIFNQYTPLFPLKHQFYTQNWLKGAKSQTKYVYNQTLYDLSQQFTPVLQILYKHARAARYIFHVCASPLTLSCYYFNRSFKNSAYGRPLNLSKCANNSTKATTLYHCTPPLHSTTAL